MPHSERLNHIEEDLREIKENTLSESGWKLDKHVPIALIATLMLQTLVVGVWVGTIQQRVASIETTAIDAKDRTDRMDETLAEIKGDLREIKTTINLLLPRKPGP